jgi:hypothetical protein
MADATPRSLALLGMTTLIYLCEFQGVGLEEVVPGFAVVIVDVGLAAARKEPAV